MRNRLWWALLPHIGFYADNPTLRQRLAYRLWRLTA